MSGTVSKRLADDAHDWRPAPRPQQAGNLSVGEWLDSLIVSADEGTPVPPPADRSPVPTAAEAPDAARRRAALGSAPRTPEKGRLKEQQIREAVAAITRRQMALDGGAAPARPALREGTATEVGHAVMALEARLSAGRAERVTDAPAARRALPGTASASGLDAEAGDAFERLGQDLRRAMHSLDPTLGGQDAVQRPVPALRHHALGPQEAGRGGATGQDAMPSPSPRPALADLMSSTADVSVAPGRVEVRAAALSSAPAPDGHALWADVRALLDRFGPGSPLEALDRQMQDLASKLEQHLGAASPSSLIDDVARRIDALQVSVKQPFGEGEGLDRFLRSIEERFERTHPASFDMRPIEETLKGLAGRIEQTRNQPDSATIDALHRQIERLGERLERSNANLSSLDAVEHSLRDLFAQLDETRHAAIDAAGQAARTAARDALRSALQNPAVAGVSDARSDITERMAREVRDLKLRHETSEHRTQAMLTDLHRAVETLVSKLQRDDRGDQGAVASSPALPSPLPDGAPRPGAGRGVDVEAPEPVVRREPPEAGVVDRLIEPGEDWRVVRTDPPSRDASGPVPHSAPPVPTAGASFFIAAARRAARAMPASASPKGTGDVEDARSPGASPEARPILDRLRDYLVLRRRPLLLSLAALVVMLGALEALKAGSGHPEEAKLGAPAPQVVAQGSDPAPAAVPAADAAPGTAPAAKPEAKEARAPAPAPAPGPWRQPDAADLTRAATPPPAAKVTNPFLVGVRPNASGLGEGLKALALGGDAAAQYEVGQRYADGRGVPRDPKAAAGWFEKAAAQGLAAAQYRLAAAYEKGVGETLDPVQAVLWYGRAAEAGNTKAMHNLAVMSAEGAVGKPDYAKAAALFRRAAALGVRDSQFNLAVLSARGLGVEQNLGESYKWFTVAAKQGDEDAAKRRDEVATRLDTATLQAAKAAGEAFVPDPVLRSANEVTPPAEGWEAAIPARHDTSGQASPPAKAPTM